MTPDIQELRRLAEAARDAKIDGAGGWAWAAYHEAFTPDTILALIEENERLSAIEDELIDMFSYLGAGLPDQATNVRSRIEWAVDHHASAAIQRAADLIENISRDQPRTSWGEIKTQIIALKPSAQHWKE